MASQMLILGGERKEFYINFSYTSPPASSAFLPALVLTSIYQFTLPAQHRKATPKKKL